MIRHSLFALALVAACGGSQKHPQASAEPGANDCDNPAIAFHRYVTEL